jgi:LPXTG-motif cell wall-anchored protein
MSRVGLRLRVVAAALLTMVTLGAVAPVAASAQQSVTGGGDNKCFEQVQQYRYKREKLVTEYQYQKQTHERSRANKHADWGPWSEWSWWSPSSYQWSATQVDVLEGPAPHGQQTDKYQREYRYVQNGTTRQVSNGWETTDWLTAPPEGEGWVQFDQRTANGQEIPCDNVETKKVTLCHATSSESNPYEKITVSVAAFLNAGHISHGGDIYAAFSYVKHGQTINVPASGDTSLLQYEECQRPKPQKPDFPPEVVEVYTDCTTGAGFVTGTRSTTSFKAVFNTSTWTWDKVQDGEPVVEQISRPLTDAEQNACRPSKDPNVVREDVGTPECGDTTIKVKVTTTTYSFTYDAQTKTWVKHTSTDVTYETRDLKAEEQVPCPAAPPVVKTGYDCVADQPTAWVDPATSDEWTASGDLDTSPLGYRFEITARDGFTFDGEKTITLEGTIDADRSCEVTPEQPTLNGTEECAVLDTYTIPTTLGVDYFVDGEKVDAGTYDLAAGETVVITAAAQEAYRLVGDGFRVELTGGTVELCSPTDWESPTAAPVCGADNDTINVPADTDDVYYEVGEWENGTRMVTARWTHDDSVLQSWTFTDTNEDCPTTTTEPEDTTTTTQPPAPQPQGLDIQAFAPACFNDAPYIEIVFGDQPQYNGRTATVTFVANDGNVVGTETATYQAGTTVRFVYPGAEVDAAGNPVDWPGWAFNGTQWVHDESDAYLREGLTVVVEVNPTATGVVTYPDATAGCADPAVVPTTPAAVPSGTLPQTGSSTGLLAAIAGGLVLAGGATLFGVRRTAVRR